MFRDNQKYWRSVVAVIVVSFGVMALAMIPRVHANRSPIAEASATSSLSGQAAIARLKQQELYDSLREAMAAAITSPPPVPTLTEQAKLTASDGAGGDEFGYDVAISGNTVVVGARLDDDAGAESGSAYIFVLTGQSWSEQARLNASDGAAFDLFGASVAVHGETVVVGAPGADIGANINQGSAYIFVRHGQGWSEQAKLTASDGAADDLFGELVAINGATVVVGVRFDDIGANLDQGSAYVFARSGQSWSEQAKLIASDGAANNFFGLGVDISGGKIVVGAPLADIGGNSFQGAAYIFVRSGQSWSEQAKLTASDGAAGDLFAISVAIHGETVVVGAILDDIGANVDQGSAYIFAGSGQSWGEVAKLTASDGTTSDLFGTSVAIHGGMVAVGASGDDDACPTNPNCDSGSAYVFVRGGQSWNEQAKLVASDGAISDLFGASVAVHGETVVVGAPSDLRRKITPGSAYVFQHLRGQ